MSHDPEERNRCHCHAHQGVDSRTLQHLHNETHQAPWTLLISEAAPRPRSETHAIPDPSDGLTCPSRSQSVVTPRKASLPSIGEKTQLCHLCSKGPASTQTAAEAPWGVFIRGPKEPRPNAHIFPDDQIFQIFPDILGNKVRDCCSQTDS